MKTSKKHEWGFMGNDARPFNENKGDLAYCPLCNQWCWTDDMEARKYFKMTKNEYQAMIREGILTGV